MAQKHIRHLVVVFLLGGFVLSAVSVQTTWAETRYVTDILVLTLRDSPGNEYKVIRTLRTGMPLEVLEEQEQHLRVRTRDGEEGWVPSQYITTEIPKPIIIAQLKDEVSKLSSKLAALEKERMAALEQMDAKTRDQSLTVQTLEESVRNHASENAQLAAQLKELTSRYDSLSEQSKDVVALMAERDTLKEENDRLRQTRGDGETKIAKLEEENQRLTRNEILYWFLAGGGVFFVGLLIGKSSRTKKRF